MSVYPQQGQVSAVAADRLAYLDNLKVILVAGVIFGHAWAGYDQIGGWVYTDAREVSVATPTRVAFEIVLGPFGLFAMGVFFLIAGMLTPSSLGRKGPQRFARDRLLRLGIPLAVFTFVVWPPVRHLLDRLAGKGSAPGVSLQSGLSVDASYLWFLEILLIFSLGYAAWRAISQAAPLPSPAGQLGLRHLIGVAAAVAAGSFVVRIWFPLGSTQYPDLHLSQWPQYVVLFGLGIAGARRGWFTPVPARLRRECGMAALVAALGVGGLAVVVAAAGTPAQHFLGGGTWPSLVTAAAEGVLAVTVSVWLLGLAQNRWNRTWGSGHAARGAYAAFLLQGLVLVALALALRPVAVPAEVKAIVVSVLGVLICFRLAWLLATRTFLGRIL